jgi:gluconokinase
MVVLVMGVAGSGKSVVGAALAEALGWRFADADAFHPVSNIDKMSRGIPLTDADRAPWLDAMRDAIANWTARRESVVLACSALKVTYRDRLAAGRELRIVYLKGNFDLIHSRLATRPGHFMQPEMLASQFADLEEPENAIVVEVSRSADEIVAEIITKLGAND